MADQLASQGASQNAVATTLPSRDRSQGNGLPTCIRRQAGQDGLATTSEPLAAVSSAARAGRVGAATLRAKSKFATTDKAGENGEPIRTNAPALTAALGTAAAPLGADDLSTSLKPAGQNEFVARSDTNERGLEPREVDVLTAREVARLLRVNIKTVYENAKAGTIPCVQLGRHFRFSRRAIMARLAECKSASRQQGH
jgi:excisionase family DNA binding protein